MNDICLTPSTAGNKMNHVPSSFLFADAVLTPIAYQGLRHAIAITPYKKPSTSF